MRKLSQFGGHPNTRDTFALFQARPHVAAPRQPMDILAEYQALMETSLRKCINQTISARLFKIATINQIRGESILLELRDDRKRIKFKGPSSSLPLRSLISDILLEVFRRAELSISRGDDFHEITSFIMMERPQLPVKR